MKSDRIFPDVLQVAHAGDRAFKTMVLRGTLVIQDSELGTLRDSNGLLVTEDGTPVGHVDYSTGMVAKVDAWGAHLQAETEIPVSTHKLNADQTVAVATDVFWNEDMTTCPRGAKVQLLGAGGVAVYGDYHGDAFWVGWCPLPKRRK